MLFVLFDGVFVVGVVVCVCCCCYFCVCGVFDLFALFVARSLLLFVCGLIDVVVLLFVVCHSGLLLLLCVCRCCECVCVAVLCVCFYCCYCLL